MLEYGNKSNNNNAIKLVILHEIIKINMGLNRESEVHRGITNSDLVESTNIRTRSYLKAIEDNFFR